MDGRHVLYLPQKFNASEEPGIGPAFSWQLGPV